MAPMCIKLKAKVIGLFNKIKRSLSVNINTTNTTQNKSKNHNTDKIKSATRVSQYSAVMHSPTASPVILPRRGSPRGIK